MLPLLHDCWARVKDQLQKRAGEAAYAAWLAELRPVLLERSTVYLEAGTRLVADRVRSLFRPLLAELLSAEIGTEVQVELQAREPDRLDRLEVSPQQPVIDDSNRTAHLVLKNLASGRPLPSNLFFFHGPAGVGKTFLLQWWRAQLRRNTLWFDLPGLLLAFQSAHHEGRVELLQQELTADRPLVLDELHRVAGKPKLQQFLIAVLRSRETLPVPTILASRWHPQEIRDLEPRLATMLLGGFVAAIGRPGPVARLRYLRALEGAPSRNGRASAVEALAQQPAQSYPELRAQWASSRPESRPPKYLELIDPAKVFANQRDRVAAHFGITVQDLLGKGQGRRLSRARKVLAMLCLEHGLTGSEVGRFLAGRTRAAVSYMVLSLQQELAASHELRQELEGLL
jgi:chromosomal replication initiator protein